MPWGVVTDIAGDVFYPNGGSIDEIPADSAMPIRAWLSGSTYVASLGYIAVVGSGKLYFDAGVWRRPLHCNRAVRLGRFRDFRNLRAGMELVVGLYLNRDAYSGNNQCERAHGSARGRWCASTDFSGTPGSCGASDLSVGYVCSVNVTFAPKRSGASSAALQVLDANGNVSSSTLLYGVGTGPQVVHGPETQNALLTTPGLHGIAVDEAGNVFATLPNSGLVLESSFTGAGAGSWIGTGFGYPYGLAVNSAGEVFVADATCNRLLKVAKDGSQILISQNLNTPMPVIPFSCGMRSPDKRIGKKGRASRNQATSDFGKACP
jgi:DNA-binding beta-propeller fold protein YncE